MLHVSLQVNSSVIRQNGGYQKTKHPTDSPFCLIIEKVRQWDKLLLDHFHLVSLLRSQNLNLKKRGAELICRGSKLITHGREENTYIADLNSKLINSQCCTAWKVSKYGTFSGPNTGKYRPEKLRIWTLFMECWIYTHNFWLWAYTFDFQHVLLHLSSLF